MFDLTGSPPSTLPRVTVVSVSLDQFTFNFLEAPVYLVLVIAKRRAMNLTLKKKLVLYSLDKYIAFVS